MRATAFKLWRKHGGNCTAVRRDLDQEYDVKIPTSTITRWRDKYDWEVKDALARNEIKRYLRASDDPVLRELAMDDIQMARFLGLMTRMIRDVLGNARSRKGLLPKNPRELIDIIKFIREERDRILDGGMTAKANARNAVPGVVYNDNRKVSVVNQMKGLSPARRLEVVRNLSEMPAAIKKANKKKDQALVDGAFEEEFAS